MKFDEWVELGIEKGFAGFVFDWVQSGPQMSDAELEKLENGDDIEIPCLRIFRQES
jgi:hypothetical protein